MFTSFYLSRVAEGVEMLFLFTLGCALVYFLGCLTYRDGRTPRAIKRALMGLAEDCAAKVSRVNGSAVHLAGVRLNTA